MLQSHVNQAIDQYKSAYPMELKFDYIFKANEAPFDIQSIYHDDKFTYIQTTRAGEVFRLRDQGRQAQPHHLRSPRRHVHHSEGHGQRICRIRQEANELLTLREGMTAMTGDTFSANVDPEPELRHVPDRAQGSSAKKPQDARVLGRCRTRDCRRHLQLNWKEDPSEPRGSLHSRWSRTIRTTTCKI